MVDVSKIAYKVFLLRENGEQLDITDIASGLNWEENEGELAQRVSLTLANIMHKGSRVSNLAKPNCYIIGKTETGGKTDEVARGKRTELFDLQASQDNRYISAGVSTKTALMGIFDDWGISVEKYDGPTVANAKTTFKNQYLSDIILELLETAHKHGARRCIVRASKGKVSVIPRAGNETIYCFEEANNLEMVKYKLSTSEMVTVVKVVATEDEDKRQAVEAVINGKTEYGKRQKIYVRDKDDTLATATAAAKEILENEGEPTVTMNLKAPDIPTIRKGDKIKITSRVYTGYATVISISHDAGSRTMTVGVEKFKEETDKVTEAPAAAASKDYKVGDIVTFNGGYHYYTSMDTSPRGGLRTAGKAWIQNINKNGKHKYALIGGVYKSGVGGNSNVYGWVDENTVS